MEAKIRKTVKQTTSLCPECLAILPAEIFEEDNKIWIEKTCAKHGSFKEIYWSDAELYHKASRFACDGRGLHNPHVEKRSKPCPFDCGLCSQHKSHTALANLVVTNRCDLNCWYCFFFAEKAGYIYEPTLEQIRQMARSLRSEKPIRCNAIQLTGGEPTLREDLVEIVKLLKEEGFGHVQLNTDGIRLSRDPGLVKRLREAGVNTLYLSFDGVTPKTNPKNHWEAPGVVENCREIGFGIVLVPTLIKSVNDHEIGDIIQFGLKNADTIRAINFQPVSLVGRMPKSERDKYSITIPVTIEKIEEQTNGQIVKDDFYTVPMVVPISRFLEAMSGRPYYELSTHFACGMATYVFKEGGKIIPINHFLDAEGFVEFLNEKTAELQNGGSRHLTGAQTLLKLNSFIDRKKQPKSINLAKLLFDIFIRRDYKSMSRMHKKTLFIGMMHFMDLYNYDIERVERCCIHYTVPNGHVIPFCAFNVLPSLYRDKIQKQFGLSIPEWEKKTGRKLKDDYYKRKLPAAKE